MRVLICGSRNWVLYGPILERVRALDPDTDVVIEGGQRGADLLARQAALECEIPFFEFPAQWKRTGRSAGPKRNARMLRDGEPDLVIAFHEDPGLGTGTADMVRKANLAGVPVEVHYDDEYEQPPVVDF